MNIIFYDDDQYRIDNTLFPNEIKIAIPGTSVFVAHSLEYLEVTLERKIADVVILDIMGAENGITGIDSGNKVAPNHLGIEILKRLRKGYYNKYNQNPNVPIIMRSALGDDVEIQRVCKNAGANHIYLLSAANDKEIIKELIKIEQFLNE